MHYSVSSIRLDFANVAHAKTAAFFRIPGDLTATEVVSAISFSGHLNIFNSISALPLLLVTGPEPFP